MINCDLPSIKNSKSKQKVRDERIDSVKYWLIVLVIAGHIFMRSEFSSFASIVTWKCIYIFHMPLFIFISGYFSRKKNKKDLWPSIWSLLEPLLLFHTFAIIVYLLYNDSISVEYILTPWSSLWYLLSLIIWRLLLQIIPESIICNTKLIIITTFCISILAGFIPFNEMLSLQRTFSFMPFFFIGYCMRGKKIYLPKKYKPMSFLFLITIIVVLMFSHNYLGSLTHSTPYRTMYGALNRIAIFCLAIPMSLAFINICPKRAWTARQGKLTMQYYIYHTLAIPPLMMIADKLDIPMTFVTATVFVLIITIGLQIASYLHNFRKYTNPSSFFNKNNKE